MSRLPADLTSTCVLPFFTCPTAASTSASNPVPGNSGTPLASAIARAVCLSPKSRICPGVGPMKAIPASSHLSANSAFSLKNPYPGWIASAPVARAASRISSPRK